MYIRDRFFNFNTTTYLMGILNVTPDSFADGGMYDSVDKAVGHAIEMADEGADIIDVGGESTRPGAQALDADIEEKRVIPVIRAIRKVSDIPISIDTYHASVAKAAIDEGADIINDVSALSDPDMADVIIDAKCPCILMHNSRLISDDHNNNTEYAIKVMREMSDIAQRAEMAGISSEGIILDPGIGFGKNTEENLILMASLNALNEIGYPLMLGCSRKRFIAEICGEDEQSRIYGTMTTTMLAKEAGVGIVRVHDVAANAVVLRLLNSVNNKLS